jgi:hypothetical protein
MSDPQAEKPELEATPTDAAIERSQSLIAAVLGPDELLRLAAENVVLAHAQGFDLAGPIEELRKVLDRA